MPADASIPSMGPNQSLAARHGEQSVRSPGRGLSVILLLIPLLLLAGCTSLPADLDKPGSRAFQSGSGTELGEAGRTPCRPTPGALGFRRAGYGAAGAVRPA